MLRRARRSRDPWVRSLNRPERTAVVKWTEGRNWEKIKERFKRVKGLPTVGFLLKFHDALIPEAVKFSSVFEVKEEWDAWWRDNPDKDPPEELERRFEKHSKDMESLGLLG